MADVQLQLFHCATVLRMHLGADFFKSLPREPGVYLMRDALGRVIYVGKAKDLRARVGSYRYVAHTHGRRLQRLVGSVRRIDWETTGTEAAALLRENQLLAELRPRFNRMNTWPKGHRFLWTEPTTGGLQMELRREPGPGCYGAFKGLSQQILTALARLLWSSLLQASYEALPRQFVRGSRTFSFAVQNSAWCDQLHAFLAGTSDALLQQVAVAPAETQLFFRTMREADLATVALFYLRGPKRNRDACIAVGREPSLIAQEELTELLLRARHAAVPAALPNPPAIKAAAPPDRTADSVPAR